MFKSLRTDAWNQLPALVQTNKDRSLTVVICPTKSLIMDQMTKLCKLAPAVEAVWCVCPKLPL